MSAELSPAILRFLEEWTATKGYGLTWRLADGCYLRSDEDCCPITAESRAPAGRFAEVVPEWLQHDSLLIVSAADRAYPLVGEIRRRLLEGVGLA